MRVHSDRTFAVGALALLALLTFPSAARAATTPPNGLTWEVSISGKKVSSTGGDTVELAPRNDVPMLLTFHNTGPTKQDVNSVRLAGKVIGMSFFAFTTRLDLEVPARQELATEVQLNLSELDGTATGLIPAEISLIRVDGSVIDSRTFISDVRGSLRSAYGLFGLAVAGLTAVFLIGLIRDIAARRLPHNRWQRGIRFLAPGVGAGLTATFTLSATRVLAPQAGVWVPLILVFGALAFLLGYFTPTPDDETQSWQESLERQGEQQPPREISLDSAAESPVNAGNDER